MLRRRKREKSLKPLISPCSLWPLSILFNLDVATRHSCNRGAGINPAGAISPAPSFLACHHRLSLSSLLMIWRMKERNRRMFRDTGIGFFFSMHKNYLEDVADFERNTSLSARNKFIFEGVKVKLGPDMNLFRCAVQNSIKLTKYSRKHQVDRKVANLSI